MASGATQHAASLASGSAGARASPAAGGRIAVLADGKTPRWPARQVEPWSLGQPQKQPGEGLEGFEEGAVYCEECEMWINGPTQYEDHKMARSTGRIRNALLSKRLLQMQQFRTVLRRLRMQQSKRFLQASSGYLCCPYVEVKSDMCFASSRPPGEKWLQR